VVLVIWMTRGVVSPTATCHPYYQNHTTKPFGSPNVNDFDIWMVLELHGNSWMAENELFSRNNVLLKAYPSCPLSTHKI